jgi:hypothetical protein
LTEDIWEEIKQCAKQAQSRLIAVAYVSSLGMKLLRLQRGDVLVLDMSLPRVRSGGTDLCLIEEYLKKGVRVYSYRSLHAKVFAFNNVAIVGSTNVSTYSFDHLTEAAIITDEPDVVSDARDFVNGLASEVERVDADYLSKCKKLYRKPHWEPGSGTPSRSVMHDWTYQVMRQITPRVAYRPQHGHFINLSKRKGSGKGSRAVGAAYLGMTQGRTASSVSLRIYPADDIEQAKPFYGFRPDPDQLQNLGPGWKAQANLHFGGPFGRGWPPRENRPPVGFRRYVEYWTEHPHEIREFKGAHLGHKLRQLRREGLISNVVARDDVDRLKKFKNFGIRPGIKMEYRWPEFTTLPTPAAFAPRVLAKINEALKIWGEQFG